MDHRISAVEVSREATIFLQVYINGIRVLTFLLSGGELIYLTEIFKKARFFISCLFGIIFVLLGNSAANCIAFAINLLQLCGRGNDRFGPDGTVSDNDDLHSTAYRFQVTAVAIGSTVTVCFVHAMWRKWGIRINNIFAVMKILILISILIFAVVAGALGKGSSKNFRYSDHTEAEHYGVSLLYVVFSYGGWNQANYVRALPDKAFRRHVLGVYFSRVG